MTETTELSASERMVQELLIATNAGVGVIAVRVPSTEVWRVLDEIFSIAMSERQEFRVHTSDQGWCRYQSIDPDDIRAPEFDPLDPQENIRETIPVDKAFEALYGSTLPEAGFYVMLDLYFTFNEMQTQVHLRKQVHRAISNDQRLFLIIPEHAEIPDAVAPLLHMIDYQYPTRSELSQSLDDIIETVLDPADRPGSATDMDEDGNEHPTFSDEERDAILSNGQGMTANAFETAIAMSLTTYSIHNETNEGYGVDDITEMLRFYKTQLLSKTNVLELQKPVPAEDIGGLDLFKEWMEQRAATYTDFAKEHGVTPSRGALVVGPPGTGKSMVAKAAGSILNMPVIRFDVGRVFNSYVGQSEQSMRAVLSMLDAMAPCVLMLDEIDKGFAGMSGGTGDSGTTQRVFGTFLTWMQERDQTNRPVFLIMTANRVQGLPPELLRKGRVDEIWSVNTPNGDERTQIAEIHARMRGQEILKEDMPSIKGLTEGLVGAEIEALIEDALVLSLSKKKPGLNYDLIDKAKGYLKPMAQTRADDFRAMQEWAKANARPASSPMSAPETNTAGSKVRRKPKRRSVKRGQ